MRTRRPISWITMAVLVASGCSGSDGAAPVSTAPATTEAVATAPSTDPPVTDPPVTDAPAATTADPVVTDAPVDSTSLGATPSIPPGGEPKSVACADGSETDLTCWTVAVPLTPSQPDGTTIDLRVTVRRADPDVWTAPVLLLEGTAPWYNPAPGTFRPELAGHDLVRIDLRGYGNSDGAVTCPDLLDFSGFIQADVLTDEAATAIDDCLANGEASDVPLSSMVDHTVVAADFVAVREALAIDRWSIYSSASGANIALHLIAVDEPSISAWFATSPETVGNGWSPNSTAEAFQRYAADCAAAPTCAATGDVAAIAEQAIEAAGSGITTGVVQPGTDVKIVLDAGSMQAGIRFAMGDPGLAPALPGLLAGIVDGTGVDTVAGYFVTLAPPMTPIDLAIECQALDFVFSGTASRDDDAAGIFTGVRFDSCDGRTVLPQFSEPPEVTTDIPVLAITTSYDGRSSASHVAAITAGFSDVTHVEVPGIANAPRQLTDCFLTVAASFLTNPGSVDTTCLSAPSTSVFG